MKSKTQYSAFPETRINCTPGEVTAQSLAGVSSLHADDVTAFLAGINIVLATDDLAALSARLLSLFLNVIPETARGVVFMSDDHGKLLPLATRVKTSASQRFSINRSILKNVIRSQNPISHVFAGKDGKQTGVVGLPVGSEHGRGVVYLEVEGDGIASLGNLSALAGQIIGVISPKFASIQLAKKINVLVSNSLTTINAVIEAKDTYTSGHSQRVATYSQAIGAEMGLSARELDNLLISAVCHDIGKVGVPDAILKKPGLLSVEEFEEMKAHPLIGAAIVEGTEGFREIIGGIKYHHERFDGTGYPSQLTGEKIPLFGRIIAIADALDAMTSGRSYSGYLSIEEATAELALKTDLFDPEILKAFVRAQDRGRISQRTGTTITALP